MKEWDIWGVKTYSDPSYIFSGGQDPQPKDLRKTTPLVVQSNCCRGGVEQQLIRSWIVVVTAALTGFYSNPHSSPFLLVSNLLPLDLDSGVVVAIPFPIQILDQQKPTNLTLSVE